MSLKQMKKFRKNVAMSFDGGGIRGIVATKALAEVEKKLIDDGHIKKTLNEKVGLFVGTSTGAIIAAALAAGVAASELNRLYRELGKEVFKRFGRWGRYLFEGERYSNEKLEFYLNKILEENIGEGARMNVYDSMNSKIDVVFTTFDLVSNKIRFIKPWNKPAGRGDENFTQWTVVKALLSSSAAPTYFPSVEGEYGQYIDGGVSSYNNPCYIALYEILNHLNETKNWTMKNTTLISIGTGRGKPILDKPGKHRLGLVKLSDAILNAFMTSANDQQVALVEEKAVYNKLDFRRFQVNLRENIAMDDTRKIEELEKYGEELGKLILNDEKEKLDEHMWRDPDSSQKATR